MGYAVHITRASQAARSDEAPISLDEWRAVVARDPSLQADDDDETSSYWTEHPDPNDLPGFRWTEGRIEVEDPDGPTIAKAVRVAHELRARVLGDDGEVHRGPTDAADRASRAPRTARQRLVRDALNRGWFHGGWVRRGLIPRPVRLTVHSTDGRSYFLIVVYRSGPLRDVDEQTPIDVVPLSADLAIEPHRFLGRTVGFRVVANGKAIAVRVGQPDRWLRWLRHPGEPVELRIT